MALMHKDLIPPVSLEGHSDKEIALWRTEYDVTACLRDLGHEVVLCGVHDDLRVIRSMLDEFNPHITFNLLEEFHGVADYTSMVVSHLELLRHPYTGCNSRGLLLARDKSLSKQILAYHRIATPRSVVVAMARVPRIPKRMRWPLFVKSLTEHASLGIAQASVVHSEERLRERIQFIHESVGTDALVEEYIDGREFYVGVMGNQRIDALPVWEIHLEGLPEGAPRIATRRVKWDERYQKRIKLTTSAVSDLPDTKLARIQHLCKRAYRSLGLSGYARLDLRMDRDETVYVIEANPNPDIAFDEDFADSAAHLGIDYRMLIQRILNLGLRYHPLWKR